MNHPDHPYRIDLVAIRGSDELAVEVHTPAGASCAGRLWLATPGHWTGNAVGCLVGTPFFTGTEDIVTWLADRVVHPARAAQTADGWASEAPGPSLWSDYMRLEAHQLRQIAKRWDT